MITPNLLQTSSKYFWEHTEGIFHVLFSYPMTVMILFPCPSSPAVTLLDKVMPLMPKSPSYAADAKERDYWCWCLTKALLPGSVSIRIYIEPATVRFEGHWYLQGHWLHCCWNHSSGFTFLQESLAPPLVTESILSYLDWNENRPFCFYSMSLQPIRLLGRTPDSGTEVDLSYKCTY